jgi:peptidylprolyl isomerase
MRRRPIVLCLLLALLAPGLAACGSSKAPGVVQAPSGGSTTAPQITPPPTTPTTPTTAVKPPPQLAKEPVVSVPKAPAPSHLVVKDLIKGSGKLATDGSTVTVNYVGVVYKTGKQFDASWNRHQPFTTSLTSGPSGVIAGWVQGIPGMKVGGRRELIIPPALGYGAKGAPGIPPNSTLVFVVDLLSAS